MSHREQISADRYRPQEEADGESDTPGPPRHEDIPPYPPQAPGSRLHGLLLIGLSLLTVLVVAGALLVVGRAVLPSPAASAPSDAPREHVASPSPNGEAVEYAEFDDGHLALRYPREWELLDRTEAERRFLPGVLSDHQFNAPTGEHQICFSVFELEEGEDRTPTEHHEDWESELADYPQISDWQRIGLEEGPGPGDQETSYLEVNYHNTDWERPERWMLWRYTVLPEEGVGYSLQFNIPASDLAEYEKVVDEVFDSFEPVL